MSSYVLLIQKFSKAMEHEHEKLRHRMTVLIDEIKVFEIKQSVLKNIKIKSSKK